MVKLACTASIVALAIPAHSFEQQSMPSYRYTKKQRHIIPPMRSSAKIPVSGSPEYPQQTITEPFSGRTRQDSKNGLLANVAPNSLSTRLGTMMSTTVSNRASLVHGALGLGSIGFGIQHVIDVVAHGWTAEDPVPLVVAGGLVHILASGAGLTRLNFWNAKERARVACFWPILPFNCIFMYMSLTEWSLGQDVAPFTMFSAELRCALVLGLGLVGYQLREIFKAGCDGNQQKSDLWLDGGLLNVLGMLASMQIVYIFLFGIQLWTSLNVDPMEFSNFVATYPEFGHIASNVNMDSAFASNLGALAVTLFKYNTINKRSMYSIMIGSNTLVTASVILSLRNIAEGACWHDYWSIVGGCL